MFNSRQKEILIQERVRLKASIKGLESAKFLYSQEREHDLANNAEWLIDIANKKINQISKKLKA